MTPRYESDAGDPRIGDRFLEWKAVKSLTGFSRTTAWRRQKAGDFPTPRQISPGRVGWLESELRAWQETRTPRGRSALPAYKPIPNPGPMASPDQRCEASPEPPQPAVIGLKPKRRRKTVDERQGAFDF